MRVKQHVLAETMLESSKKIPIKPKTKPRGRQALKCKGKLLEQTWDGTTGKHGE